MYSFEVIQEAKIRPLQTVKFLNEELLKSRKRVQNEKGALNRKKVTTRHIILEVWGIKQRGKDIYIKSSYKTAGGLYSILKSMAETQEKPIEEIIKNLDVLPYINTKAN